METKRILYINGGIMHRGGIESYMMNYYRHFDKSRIQIDFVVHGYEKGVYDDEIQSYGGKIFHVEVKTKNPFKNAKQLKEIFQNNKYELVHSHMDAMSYVPLKIAKQCNIPIRIAHSHNMQHLTTNWVKYQLNEYAKKGLPKVATHLFACSEDAGVWLFGNENANRIQVVPNAIDTSSFQFSSSLRVKIRKQLQIPEGAVVLGHIGRFDYQKNHAFLLEVFSEIYQRNSSFFLVMIGDGELKAKMQKHAQELQISQNVRFVDACQNVNEYYNAFDLFLLPSHFEGLGIVLIEAQANGLQCFASDNVPRSANITGRIRFLPLQKELWENKILKADILRSQTALRQVRCAGYEIKDQAKKLQNKYEELLIK